MKQRYVLVLVTLVIGLLVGGSVSAISSPQTLWEDISSIEYSVSHTINEIGDSTDEEMLMTLQYIESSSEGLSFKFSSDEPEMLADLLNLLEIEAEFMVDSETGLLEREVTDRSYAYVFGDFEQYLGELEVEFMGTESYAVESGVQFTTGYYVYSFRPYQLNIGGTGAEIDALWVQTPGAGQVYNYYEENGTLIEEIQLEEYRVSTSGVLLTFHNTLTRYDTTTEELIYNETWSVTADSMEEYPSRAADTEVSTTESTNFSIISIIGVFAIALRKRNDITA